MLLERQDLSKEIASGISKRNIPDDRNLVDTKFEVAIGPAESRTMVRARASPKNAHAFPLPISIYLLPDKYIHVPLKLLNHRHSALIQS